MVADAGGVTVVKQYHITLASVCQHTLSDLILRFLPVFARHRPHHRLQAIAFQRRKHPEPARAVRSPEEARRLSMYGLERALALLNFAGNPCRGAQEKRWMCLGMIGDFMAFARRPAG